MLNLNFNYKNKLKGNFMFNKIFLISILLFTFSEAKDSFSSERLLGISVGYAGVESTSQIGLKQSNRDVEFGFRIGAQNKEWRTLLVGDASFANNHKYQKAILSFDRFVWQSLYKTDDIVFKPYLGGHIGYMRYTSDDLTESGLLYGANLGLTWNVLREVDFDLGYRYSVSNINSIDSIDAVTLGVNYIY